LALASRSRIFVSKKIIIRTELLEYLCVYLSTEFQDKKSCQGANK